MTSAVLNYLSFKCSHARSLSGIRGGVLREISDDLCFSEISQPCFDPVAVAGVCITSKYFCEMQEGKPIRWMKIGLMCLQKISKQH